MLKGVDVWLRRNILVGFVGLMMLNFVFDVFAVVKRESYDYEMIVVVYLSARLCEGEDLVWMSSWWD